MQSLTQPDAWIDRLLEAVEAMPSLQSEAEPPLPECSPERCERERELAAARLAEWTA